MAHLLKEGYRHVNNLMTLNGNPTMNTPTATEKNLESHRTVLPHNRTSHVTPPRSLLAVQVKHDNMAVVRIGGTLMQPVRRPPEPATPALHRDL